MKITRELLDRYCSARITFVVPQREGECITSFRKLHKSGNYRFVTRDMWVKNPKYKIMRRGSTFTWEELNRIFNKQEDSFSSPFWKYLVESIKKNRVADKLELI